MTDRFNVKDLLLRAAVQIPNDKTYDRRMKDMGLVIKDQGVLILLKSIPTASEKEVERVKTAEARRRQEDAEAEVTAGLRLLDEALMKYGRAVGLDGATVDAIVDRDPAKVAKTWVTAKKALPIATRAASEISSEGWKFKQHRYAALHGRSVQIVGQFHRPRRDQEVLSTKQLGHMILLVAEPDNALDINAIIVLAWEVQTSNWRHVGYVPREQASALRAAWPDDDLSLVIVGHVQHVPTVVDGYIGGNNISVLLSGQTRKYRNYKV